MASYTHNLLCTGTFALFVGCSGSGSGQISEQRSDPIVVSEPLTLPNQKGLSVLDMAAALERVMYAQTGVVPSVILEMKQYFDSRGLFSYGGKYKDISELITSLESQVPEYRWEIISPTQVVVKPANGAILDELFGEGEFKNVPFCTVFEEISRRTELDKKVAGSCVVEDQPQYLSGDLVSKVRAGTVSLLGANRSVQEVVLDVLDQLPSPIGLTIAVTWKSMPRFWSLRL